MNNRQLSNKSKQGPVSANRKFHRTMLPIKHLAVALLLFAVVTTSCGASSSGEQIVAQSVALPVSATEDAFSFPNFGSDVIREFLNSDDLMLMFGPEVCTDGNIDPCRPIAEAAAWAMMVNSARASGSLRRL